MILINHPLPKGLGHKVIQVFGGHGGTVATHLHPTCEVSGSNPGPYVGHSVVSYQWSAVYSTEP